MRIFAAIAYAVGAVPLVLTVIAGQGLMAVLAGALVTANLWLGTLVTARHTRMIRLGRWFNDGVFLAATLIVAAMPVGRWLATWWLAVPLLWAYAGVILIVWSLGAWALRGKWPASVVSRVVNAVDFLLLRDGLLAVFVACVFHGRPELVPAAAGVAAAQLLPSVVGRSFGMHLNVWLIDVQLLATRQPAVRWAMWEQWGRDALLKPLRPDDNLLRVMVTRALNGVSGDRSLPASVPIEVIGEPQTLLSLVDEAVVFLEGWLLLQQYRRGQYERIDDRVMSIKAFAGTAKAQLAISLGRYEEANAELSRSAEITRRRGLPNMAAFGELSAAVGDAGLVAVRIAQDESLSLVIRRAALFAAAYGASDAGDLEAAAALCQQAAAIEPTRRDRAVIMAEERRDYGRWGPKWRFRSSVRQVEMVERNLAGFVLSAVTGVRFQPDFGDVNKLRNDATAGREAVRSGEYATGIRILSEVADDEERRGNAFALFDACYWLARGHSGEGDSNAAYDSLRRAINSYDLYRAALIDPAGETTLGGLTLAHAYAITLLADHPELEEHPAVAAFELSEQARARGMLERLGAALPPPDGPDALVAREREAVEKYAAALAWSENSDGDTRVAALHMLRSWQAELAACWTAMAEAGGRTAEYAQLRQARPVTYDEARRMLAGLDGPPVTVFEYHITDDADMVIFVTRADLPEPAVVRVPHEHATIYKTLRLVDWHGDLRLLDEALQPFLTPILEWTDPGDIVCFVPFASMNAIPLHAMTVGAGTLLDRNPVCYVPSLTVLRHCVAKRSGGRSRALVMADSRADQPLPHARIQAAAIGALLPNERLYVGDDATLDSLHAGLDTADLLHLACHGEFLPDDPEQSGILLAAGTRLSAADLMGLRMRADLVTFSACQSAVSRHDLGEELSGLAQAAMYAGTPSVLATLWSVDEIASSVLMTAFYRRLLAGESKVTALREAQRETRAMTAADLVAYCERALPDVPEEDQWLLRHDIADARLRARDFAAALAGYEKLAAEPDPPGGAERLRLAQIRCRRALRRPAAVDYSVRPFEHPYYWAPFVLIGDWR
jgi:CHAT domain-containing protein